MQPLGPADAEPRGVTGEQVDMERLGGVEPHGRRSGVVHVTTKDDASAIATARTLAASRGRHYVLPDDVKAMAEPVLAHRISLEPEAEFNGLTVAEVVTGVLREVPRPRSAT